MFVSLNVSSGKQVDINVTSFFPSRFRLLKEDFFPWLKNWNIYVIIGMPCSLSYVQMQTSSEKRSHKLSQRKNDKELKCLYRCYVLSATYFCQRIFMFFACFFSSLWFIYWKTTKLLWLRIIDAFFLCFCGLLFFL